MGKFIRVKLSFINVKYYIISKDTKFTTLKSIVITELYAGKRRVEKIQKKLNYISRTEVLV